MTTVHVWLVDTRDCDGDLLDEEERARLATIQHPVDRRRFAAAYSAARRIVAQHAPVGPGDVRWIRGPNGKPSLWGNELQVNLSHSGDLAMIALTAQRPIGVDLQQILPTLDVAAMSARFFPADEAALVAAGGHERFAELWVRKEAVVKAAGDRLTRGLTIPVRQTRSPVHHAGEVYTLRDLRAPDGFRAAVAVLGAEPFTVVYPNEATQR